MCWLRWRFQKKKKAAFAVYDVYTKLKGQNLQNMSRQDQKLIFFELMRIDRQMMLYHQYTPTCLGDHCDHSFRPEWCYIHIIIQTHGLGWYWLMPNHWICSCLAYLLCLTSVETRSFLIRQNQVDWKRLSGKSHTAEHQEDVWELTIYCVSTLASVTKLEMTLEFWPSSLDKRRNVVNFVRCAKDVTFDW